MKKMNSKTVDLGELQSHVEECTKQLKAAQRAKQRADQVYIEALASHERSRVSLNSGIAALKEAATVPNLYAS